MFFQSSRNTGLCSFECDTSSGRRNIFLYDFSCFHRYIFRGINICLPYYVCVPQTRTVEFGNVLTKSAFQSMLFLLAGYTT